MPQVGYASLLQIHPLVKLSDMFAVLRFGGRPLPNSVLRGSPDPTTCEDCQRHRRHQYRLITGPSGGLTGLG